YTVSGPQDHSAGDDSVTDVIPVTITDNLGRQVTDNLGVHITDTAPTADDDNGGQIVEDGAETELSGNVTGNDNVFDGPGPASRDSRDYPAVIEQLSQYGSTTLGEGGQWTFTLDKNKPATQALGEGETIDVNLGYVLTDADGDSVQANLSFQIVGTNDAPILNPDVTLPDQTGEDAQQSTPVDSEGQFTDGDNGDTLTYSAEGLPPGLGLDADGIIRGTLDNSASQGGEDGVYTIIITATDSHGATVSKEFTWDVSNPAPEAVDDEGTTDEDTSLSVDADKGVLANDTDPDGDDLTVSAVNGDADAVGTVVEGSDGGTFTLRPDGSYVFNPGSSFQHLGVGQSATTSIEYTVSDGEGGTHTATLTVTVTGTNDAPTLTPNVTLPDQSGEDAQEITP